MGYTKKTGFLCTILAGLGMTLSACGEEKVEYQPQQVEEICKDTPVEGVYAGTLEMETADIAGRTTTRYYDREIEVKAPENGSVEIMMNHGHTGQHIYSYDADDQTFSDDWEEMLFIWKLDWAGGGYFCNDRMFIDESYTSEEWPNWAPSGTLHWTLDAYKN